MAQPSTGEIAVGTLIADTYEVTRLLGMGGMGAVWAAEHKRLPGKLVAVKVLLGAALDPEALARFRREAEVASRIGHPNIIEVLDFHTLPSGTPYMILEYLAGESLAARLRRGPMALAHGLEIVRQVGSALHAAHRAQVVHRDLKPDNIFLTPTDSGGELTDRVKVLDFGISKIRGSNTVQTQESALLGTPQYMSPEQAFGRNKTIDGRTDVWALGAIVYEMIVGAPAFQGDTLAQVILAVVNEPAPSLHGRPGVPDNVARAVARALEKEPDKRWQDVASFIAELTGRPLQTLDRQKSPAVDAFSSTAAGTPSPVVDPLGSTAGASSTPPSLSTQPRGEIAAVPPTHRVGQDGPSKAPMYIGLGLGAVGIAAAVFFGVMKKPEEKKALVDPNQPEVFAANAPRNPPAAATAPAPAAVTAPPVVAAAAPPPVADAAKPPVVAATPPAVTGKTPKTPKSDKPLPPEVELDLQAAEKALSGGDTAGAIHLARRTLTVQKSGKAFAVITRAYCKAGDLGNAKANFNSVSGGERAAVVKACKKSDIDLP
jgi:eukaryotic-like serine/threonine-protein kinase